MPIYEYECNNCGHTLEVKQSYQDTPKKKCPECKKYKLRRVISLIYAAVKGTATTVKQQAERNTAEMGKYELQERRQQHEKEKQQAKLQSLKTAGVVPETTTEIPSKKSWYNPEGKDLGKELKDINTVEKTKKYIIEGEK
jgi:putative FmdB family regulatory protein